MIGRWSSAAGGATGAGPRLVGLAFDCQRTESSFADPWDVSLDSLATESGLQHYLKGTP